MGEKTVNGLNFCSKNDGGGSSSSSVEVTDIERNSGNQSIDVDVGENSAIENEGFKKESSWVIDVKCEEDWENFDGEKVCRICHLDSEEEEPLESGSSMEKSDLLMLGCGCKGELSVAHSHCAEAWFKLKGNRMCEICGQTVTNIKGVGNEGFMEEWKETGSNNNTLNSADRREDGEDEGIWHGQPLCNFLTACLVIAFVIPWFFRFNFW